MHETRLQSGVVCAWARRGSGSVIELTVTLVRTSPPGRRTFAIHVFSTDEVLSCSVAPAAGCRRGEGRGCWCRYSVSGFVEWLIRMRHSRRTAVSVVSALRIPKLRRVGWWFELHEKGTPEWRQQYWFNRMCGKSLDRGYQNDEIKVSRTCTQMVSAR